MSNGGTVDIEFLGTEPERQHLSDAGADLVASRSVIIPAGGQATVGTGTAVNIPDGYVGLVFIRSSLGFKWRISLSNSVGVIDAGYQGEILVALENHSNIEVMVSEGERVAQLVVLPVPQVTFRRVESFDESERGIDGFGSTGQAA